MTPQVAGAVLDSAAGGKELPGAVSQSIMMAAGALAPFSLALEHSQLPLLSADGRGEALPKQRSDEQSNLLSATPDPAAAALAAVLQWLRSATPLENTASKDHPDSGATATDATTAAVTAGGGTAFAMPALMPGYLKSGEQGTGAAATGPGVNPAMPEVVATAGTATPSMPLPIVEIHSLADLFRLVAPATQSAAKVTADSNAAAAGDSLNSDSKTALPAGVDANAVNSPIVSIDQNATPRAGGNVAIAQSERTIGVPVHDQHWSQAIAAQILVLADHRIESATLRLTPEHLGPVEVRIDIEDSRVNVSFGAAHTDTRVALELALPRLREVLANAGMTLGDASVQQQMRGRSQNRSDGARATGGAADQSVVAMVSVRGMLGVIDEYV